MTNYHIVPEADTWKLEKENAERALHTFETKEAAVRFSTDYVEEHGGSLKIHKEDGTIQEERTYPRTADPIATPG